MDLGLRNKVAFVAGASSGMGKATALELAKEGASVAMCARSEGALHEAAHEIAMLSGGTVLPVVCDVTDEAQVQRAIATTAEHFGGLHVLVANAGGAPGGRFDDLNNEKWEQAFRLNFLSTVNLIRAALPHMKAANWGRIITITSISVKQPIDSLLLSNTVRPGVVGLVRSLATQLASQNITVNNVAPGYTLTERLHHVFEDIAAQQGITEEEAEARVSKAIPVGRMGAPEEQAAVIAFLASTRASFITGQTILVDGGEYRGIM